MRHWLRRWIVGLGLAVGSAWASGAEFHVAPDGRDEAPGTEARPFRTLERARDAVRERRRAGHVGDGPMVVWLHPGDFERERSFELSREDSGTVESPTLWRRRGEKRARILGGRKLPRFEPVTDRDVLDRLDPAARTAVVQCDARSAGVTQFGTLRSRGFGRPAVPAQAELFHGGRPMTLARWPNGGGFERIEGFPAAAGKNDDHGGNIGALEGGFRYAGDRPRRWKDPTSVWVHGYWAWDWANSYERIASIDLEARLIKTAAPHGLYGFRQGQRYYYVNALEELDEPGEWMVEASTGRLFFWPTGPAPGAGGDTLLSVVEGPLVRLAGVSHVAFEGLVIEAGRGSGVEIRDGVGNRVTGCVLRNLGNSGVVVEGGHGHGVVGCDVFDTGDGGVSLTGGDRNTLEGGGHYVENCHFRNQGRWTKCYVPAVALNGVGQRAAHNLIHDHPHCAILYWGNDHVVEFNEIHHVALETGDVGAIYTGRDYTFRGNRIRHNFIHHTGGVGMGSMGVYMDDCVSGTEIFGNIFYRVQRAAFLGGGRDHRVVNNVFVECDHAVELDGRGLDRSPVWRGMVDDTMRKRLAEVPLELYRRRYPEMRGLDAHYGPPEGPARLGEAFQGVPPEGNVVARNVVVGKWLRVGWNARESMLRLDANLTEGDPGFTGRPGPESTPRDFGLKADSRAWALGFERIPVERIGLVEDAARRSRPVEVAP